MTNENSQSEYRKELTEIIQRYEAAKDVGKSIYLDADQFADVAEEYMQQSRFADAVEVVTAGLDIHPENSTLLISLASIYLDTENLQKAHEVIDFLLSEGNDSDELKLLRVELLIAENKPEEGEKLLDSLTTDDPITLTDMSFLYLKMNNLEKAISLLDQSVNMRPNDENNIAEIGECFMQALMYNKAVDVFERLVNDHPYNISYWLKLTESYSELKDYSKALDSCEFALAIDEENGEAHAYKAHLLFMVGNYEEATAEYETAHKLGVISEEETLQLIGMNYYNEENWEKALEYFKKTLKTVDESSPYYDNLLYYLAKCSAELADYDTAIQYCESHIGQPDFDHTLTYLLLGDIYLQKNDKSKAIEAFERAIKLNPSAAVWYRIGRSLLEKEYYLPAEKALLRVKELEPDFPYLGKDLALVYIGLGDMENLEPYKKDLLESLKEYIIDVPTDENLDKINKICDNLTDEINKDEDENNGISSENN